MQEKEALLEEEFCLNCSPSAASALPSLLLFTITDSTGYSEGDEHCGQTAVVTNQATGRDSQQ